MVDRLRPDERKQEVLIPSDEAVEFVMATTMLLSDYPPKPVDVVFLHGRSFFDAEKAGFFSTAVDMIKDGTAKNILIADSEGERLGETVPRKAFAGKTLWTDRLVKMGVPVDKIIYCPHPIKGEHGFHTRNESDAFLDVCEESGFKSAVIIAQPHQLVRAMLGTVKVMANHNYNMDVYNAAPRSTNWRKMVRGSQGKELKPRMEHIEDEYKRVFAYQANGDLATFSDLFNYLSKRG